MTDVTLNLLGGFEVRAGGRSVEVSPAAQRLLALLALRRQPQCRTAAATVIWPLAESARARRHLGHLLERLPAPLADAVSVDADGLVALADGWDVDLDRALDAARRLHVDPRPVGLDLVVFRLDLLPGWFDPWLDDLQQRYHRLRMAVLVRLARHQLQAGDVDDAVDMALELADDDPLREDAQLLLVEALVARGDVTLARHQVERFRRRLQAELGVDPSPRLRAAVARIEHPAGELR